MLEVRPGDELAEQVLEVIHVLRDHVSLEELHRRWEAAVPEGYRLIGVRDVGVRDKSPWKAAAGFRVHTNTINGKILYVDDLVTVGDSRSRGFGKLLNEHLMELARSEGCATIELDSSVVRHDAHRFYLRERYDIAAHHFVRRLDG
jgi:GNAT superfamily N-acetyltransferase